MYFTSNQSVKEAIIFILAKKVSSTAQSIHEKICEDYRKCSIQGVYKELSILVQDGIIVKAKDKYNLKLTWVVSANNFFNDMYRYQIQHTAVEYFTPKEGESLTWKFGSLQRVDDFWEQSIIALLNSSGEKTMYGWMPHPWFHITDDRKQHIYEDVMNRSGFQVYRIMGGTNFLDRKFIKDWGDPVTSVSFVKSPFHELRNKYFDVIGDYIITITIDKSTTEFIHTIFDSIKSDKDYSSFDKQRLINFPAKIAIKLQHNTRKARKLRKQFCIFFGLPYRLRVRKSK